MGWIRGPNNGTTTPFENREVNGKNSGSSNH